MNRLSVLRTAILGWLFAGSLTAQQPPGEASVPTFVTGDGASLDRWPTFSPDGSSILFSRAPRRGAKFELFIVRAKGGEARPFADRRLPVSATRASWSRTNGIAFTGATRDGQAQLWLIDADGEHARCVDIPGLPRRSVYPSWYADGRRLTIVDAGERRLRLVDLERRSVTPLTNAAEVLAGMSAVSPAGDRIAFAGQANAGAYDQTENSIYLVDAEGEVRAAESAPALGRNPAWSPDGRLIAFCSRRGSPNGRGAAIFVMDEDGENVLRLTPYSWGAAHPAFSPDGRWIAFTARHPGERGVSGVAVLEVEGGSREGKQ